jgi:hypothetical protein
VASHYTAFTKNSGEPVELNDLYKNSPSGEIPTGEGQGTAIILPGTPLSKALMPWIKLFAWQGKIFDRDQGCLLNKVTLFGIQLVKAQVYKGESWLCDGESIILDYAKTSVVAHKIRDEIREVSPGIYLGNAYWEKTRLLNFVLQF